MVASWPWMGRLEFPVILINYCLILYVYVAVTHVYVRVQLKS